jgi:hypothetical protein
MRCVPVRERVIDSLDAKRRRNECCNGCSALPMITERQRLALDGATPKGYDPRAARHGKRHYFELL